MRIAVYEPIREPGPRRGIGLVREGVIVDVSAAVTPPVTDLLPLLQAGPEAIAALAHGEHGEVMPLDQVRLLAPITRPPNFVAIGLNYADHIAETGREAPEFPVFFNKWTTCVIGPGDAIELPEVSSFVDYEGELGMVIGRRCRNVRAEDAPSVIAGYTVVNDVTARDWQARSPTMTLGKSFDTHGPMGPWLVTSDEIADPHDLRIRTLVNGEVMQDASTSEMIYDCWQQIEVLSTVCTLEPGVVIATGTPAGVGIARKPARPLRAGDLVRVEIEGVGVLENPVVAEPG